MYLTAARAWHLAVGAPLERGVRAHCRRTWHESVFELGLQLGIASADIGFGVVLRVSMKEGTWGQALAEIVVGAAAAIARFWRQAIVQVGLSFGTLLVLALPFIIVILVFWYIESTGWRPQSGFYKIGNSVVVQRLAAASFSGCQYASAFQFEASPPAGSQNVA